MIEPLVSVLIPVYQRVELAVEAIDCALAQDYNNIEIIIGDNCSKDGTYERLLALYKHRNNVLLFQNEDNLGAVRNWERCLAKANGKYIKFLWSDDLMSKDYISSTVELMERYPDAAFAYSSVIIFESLKNLEEKHKNTEKNDYQTFLKTGEYKGLQFIKKTYSENYSVPVSPGCAIFKKEKLHVITEIPNKLNYSHKTNGAGPDLLMFLEALANGESFVYLHPCRSYFRRHSDSISSFDKTIMDGYFSAKLYYLKKYNLNDLYVDLNSEIISCHLGKHIFNRRRNLSVLEKYYEPDEFGRTKTSIPQIIKWKLKKKRYYAKLSR